MHALQPTPVRASPPVATASRLLWRPGRTHWLAIFAFVGAHVFFGLIADFSPPPVASLHAIGVLAIAVWLVGVRRDAEGMTCIAAYVAACDVLWRMTSAAVPWEVSKLALIAIFTVAAVRIVRRPQRFGLPLTALMLLAPSAVVTVERFGILGNGRERLSFEIGAHVALVAGVIVFSNLRIERQTLAGVLWMIIGPIVAVNTIATSGTVGLDASAYYGHVSNFASSGGYGPNQVSALIGVGAMVSIFLCYLDRRTPLRLLAAVLAVWFLAQSALTFSRGGTFNLLVALVVALPFFFRTAQVAVRFLTTVAVASVLVIFVMVPVIQHMTGNQFGERFTSSNPTLRGDLMRLELETWSQNPALGIGVGMMVRTIEDREAVGRGELPALPTHTEYTRLLAEHGVLGIGVLLVYLGLAFRAITCQRLLFGRIFAVVLLAWCAAEVAHSATRLALTAFLFALTSLEIVPDGTIEPGDDAARPPPGQREVDGDGPPPVARPRAARDLADEPAPGRDRSRVGEAPTGEAVELPGGQPA